MAADYSIDPMEGKRALVLGGLGFIGSNLAHKLVSLGAEVTIYDACLDPYGWNFVNITEIKEKVRFIKGDIRDLELLKEAVKDKDFMFNCAGQVSHVDSMKDPFLDIDINCRGNVTTLEACRQSNDRIKIIYAGTRGQMGGLKYSPADENHPDNPTDIYGADKLAAEKYHFVYYSAYGIKSCSLRINNTYGPRHQMKHGKYGILNWFIRRAMLGEPIEVFGDGSQTRDYNYVEDVSDAMILAAQSSKADGQVYLLGSGKELKFIDMVKKVIDAVGSGTYSLKQWPGERRSIEVGNFFVSYAKINKELGWHPKTSFEDGLKKTVEFYRKRLKEYL